MRHLGPKYFIIKVDNAMALCIAFCVLIPTIPIIVAGGPTSTVTVLFRITSKTRRGPARPPGTRMGSRYGPRGTAIPHRAWILGASSIHRLSPSGELKSAWCAFGGQNSIAYDLGQGEYSNLVKHWYDVNMSAYLRYSLRLDPTMGEDADVQLLFPDHSS